MITIRISILLAFSLLLKKSDDKKLKAGKKSKKNKAKNKKSTGSKSDKSSKKGRNKRSQKKGNENAKDVVEKPKYLFEVGSPVGFSHIEYELIPGRPKYQVDVVCWGPVAKVISADGEVTLKTFVKDELAWVPMCLKHVLNDLKDDDLLQLHAHVINYTIWTSKNKLGARAKSENAKAFFIREEDVDSEAKFAAAYTANPNLEKCEDEEGKRITELEKEIKSILWECADKPGAKNYGEIVTRLEFLSDPLHRHQVNKIIDSVTAGREVDCKDFVPICPPPLTDEDISAQNKEKLPQKGKKGRNKGKSNKDNISKNSKVAKKAKESEKSSKRSKKGKKGKKDKTQKKGEGVLKIAIPGEVLYTDPNINLYDLKTTSNSIIHAFILTTTANLMNRTQKHTLNPLIIKIKKISNLPVEILTAHRFKTVYAYYNVPYIARCSTVEKPLSKTIRFNEAHAHFTHTVPSLKFIDFMQTQRLHIEIRGIREECKMAPDPSLFGSEKDDNKISTKLSAQQCLQVLEDREEPTTVTLAVACYDISSLLKSTEVMLEKGSCHHPDAVAARNVYSMYQVPEFQDAITANEINLGVLFKPKTWSCLSESILADFGTTLKVEVSLCTPHPALLEVPTYFELYQRLFVVISNTEIATTLLNKIIHYNQALLGPGLYVSNLLKAGFKQTYLKPGSKHSIDTVNLSAIVTGFVIDNGTSYAFFVEGLANGFVSSIWGQIMNSPRTIMKIFYNSDFCFERRIYLDFLKFGGIYIITLKNPLEELLGKYGIYLEGNVPVPCWEALQKLNLLLKCTTMRSIIQHCLLPTSKQLMSLGLEFGVTFRWKPRPSYFESVDPDAQQEISNVTLLGEHQIELELENKKCDPEDK